MKPKIRTAFTKEGDIEATAGATHRIVVERQTGMVLQSNVHESTDMFRWLVTEARRHVSP